MWKISLKYPKLRTLKIMITKLLSLKMSWTCGFLCPNKKHHLGQCIFLSPGVLLKHQNQSRNCHNSLTPYFLQYNYISWKAISVLKYLKKKTAKLCHPSWHWLIVAKLTVSGTQLSNQNNAFLSTGDNIWIGSSLGSRGRRQVCQLVQKQAAQHLASSVPGLWKNARQAASFCSDAPKAKYLLRSHCHFQTAERVLPLWMPSPEVHGSESLVFCTAQLTQQTWDERVPGKHFPVFTFHILSFAVTSGRQYMALVKAAETTCLGDFYSSCFLIWDGSNL